VPITWRSSSCIQFGADDPVLIDGLLPADVRLIEDLRLGIGSSQFYARAQELGADLGRATSLITLLGEAGVLTPEGAGTGVVRNGPPAPAAAVCCALTPHRVSQPLAARALLVPRPLRPIAERHIAATGFTVSGARQIEDLDLITAPLVIKSAYLVPV